MCIQADFPNLIQEYGLINFFEQHLRSGVVEDDILLEVIVFIGTVCQDSNVAPLVANSSLVQVPAHPQLMRKAAVR